MGSLTVPLDLTLGDLERSKSRPLSLRSLISRKGAELGQILILKANSKPWNSICAIRLDLE